MDSVQNLPIDKDFVVYSHKAMVQAMEYATYHKLYINIYLYPKMTLDQKLEYS